MSLRGIRKRILPFMLILTIFAIIVGTMTKHVQAEAATTDQISSGYLNTVQKYLYLGKQGPNTYNFNINKKMKKEGATYTWYMDKDKGNPKAVKLDEKTGVVTAKEAGTAYIACKITLADGTIVRPEASVTVRNNISKVAINNIPEDLTIEAGKEMDFNRTILETAAGKGVKTQGITRWELADDAAGVGTVTTMGKVLPTKDGKFQIRAVCFQSKEKYKLWLTDKKAYKKYVTASSKWYTIQVIESKEIYTAATQEQLEKLLLTDTVTQIAITTNKNIAFTIPKGDYSSKTLIVNAGNADVNNYGLFKNIIINEIKDNTWIEFADGNIIHLKDEVVSFVIDTNVIVKRIIIDNPNSTLNLEIKGTVEQISVLQPSNIDITGNSENIPVNIAESAGGSTIQTSIPLNLVLNADTEVKLNKGAEDTLLDKSSSKVEVKIENNTEKPIVITTDKSGGETADAGSSIVSNGTSKPAVPPAPSFISITKINDIIGTPKVGVKLQAGAVSPAEATVNYQWMIAAKKDGTYLVIPGGTSDTYTPVDSDEGKFIKVAVGATGAFTGTVTSNATVAILASEVKLQEVAETAIAAYEGASILTLTEIAKTEELKVAADLATAIVEEVSAKAAFEQRVANRVEVIAEAKAQLIAEAKITAYETAPVTTLAEVTTAEGLKAAADTATAAVGNTAVKAAFEQRILNKAAVIAEARVELVAEAKIKAYEIASVANLTEVTKAEGLKAAADTATAVVGDATAKAAFEQRIVNRAAVIAEARAELIAEAAVTAYEAAPILTLSEIATAESLKAAADTATAAVGNASVKSVLEQRVTDRAIEIAEAKENIRETSAEDAIVAYESATIATLSEVTIAEGLKAAADTATAEVGDAVIKAAFEQRIVNRAAVIAEARLELVAVAAVTAYETAPVTTLDEVSFAEGMKGATDTAVSAVGDTAVKAALGNRVTDRAAQIAEARAELEAEEAVTAYETVPLTTLTEVALAEGMKSAVDTAISKVGDTAIKTDLDQRVTDRAEEIAEARAELQAEAAVTAYEVASITTLAEVASAEGLKSAADTAAAAVGDTTKKTAFELRIENRAAEIEEARVELVAKAAVTAYEVAPITTLTEVTLAEGLKAAADTAVTAVSDTMVKAELEQRITDRAGVIAAARKVLEAAAAVTKAENSYSQADLNAAQGLVKDLPDGEVKTAFQQRINAVQDIIDADSAVKTAESSTLQSDVDTAQSFVTALPEGTAKTALQNRINTVQGIINDRIVQLENANSVAHAKSAVEGLIYDITQAEANTELDILTAIESVISGLALEGATASVTKKIYNPAIAGSELIPNGTNGTYTFTVTLSKGAGATLASEITKTLSMNITATVYVPPEIITSKEILKFNFATIESSTAKLISKSFAIDDGYDFRGANAKSFTITDGAGNVIPVNLSWELPRKDTGYSTATLIGSAIESAIQDYFNAHGGLDNRTLWSACFEFNTGTTFTLSSFAEGVLNKITINGTDGAYFFNELSAQGTDLDTSANRSFSISDGVHTANISLNSNLTNMDGLVNKLNSSLSGYSVQAVAVKISENSFKIVGDDITVEGADIAEFFSSYISE